MKTALFSGMTKAIRSMVMAAGFIFPLCAAEAQAGWIGIDYKAWTIDSATAKNTGLSKAGTYLKIANVFPGMPAERAGLKKGDIIWEYDKRRYSDRLKFAKAVRKTPPGKTIPVVVLRDWQFRTMHVTLGTPPIQPSQARYDPTRCKDVISQYLEGYAAMLMAQKPDDFLAVAKIYGAAIERQSGNQRCAAVYFNHGVALEKARRYKAAKKAYEDYIRYASKSADIAAVKKKIVAIEPFLR